MFTYPPVNWELTFHVPGMVLHGIFLYPPPIIPLCWDDDLTTMKFIHAEVECSSSPIFTSKDIWPSGQMVSPLNLLWISEDVPPSTYIRCTKCPPISASIIIGPSVPSLSPRGGKDIVVSGEKLWVAFCLGTLSHGWIIRMASGLSFPAAPPFLGAFGLSFCFSSLMNCDNLPADHLIYLLSQLHAFVHTVTRIRMEFTYFVGILCFRRVTIGGSLISFFLKEISFGVFVRSENLSSFRSDMYLFLKPFLKLGLFPPSGCFYGVGAFFRP
ncbi:hypothetical protein Tco_1362912 [Tanacetum coccineum]